MSFVVSTFLAAIDPIQGATNIVYKLVGFGGAMILLTIVFKGLGLLQKAAYQGLLGLLGVGLLLFLFTDGANSKNLLQDWADAFLRYAQGK